MGRLGLRRRGCARTDVIDPRIPFASTASTTGATGSSGGSSSGSSTTGSSTTGSTGGSTGGCTGLVVPPPRDNVPFASDPQPIVTYLPGEVVLRKELHAYQNYGVADEASDILYDGQTGAWTFAMPVDTGRPVHAHYVASMVADDHLWPALSQYSYAVWASGVNVYDGQVDLARGEPYNSVFDDWTERTFPADCLSAPFNLTIRNLTAGTDGGWLAVDWVELHVLTE